MDTGTGWSSPAQAISPACGVENAVAWSEGCAAEHTHAQDHAHAVGYADELHLQALPVRRAHRQADLPARPRAVGAACEVLHEPSPATHALVANPSLPSPDFSNGSVGRTRSVERTVPPAFNSVQCQWCPRHPSIHLELPKTPVDTPRTTVHLKCPQTSKTHLRNVVIG